jgi:DNA-directed RNA polymerase subunit K/omega
MSYKNATAERTTITRNVNKLYTDTGNVYKSVVIISKRANQIASEMKEELQQKLSEFASNSDNLEEIFENREQIEISKHYERLPKPVAIAIQEFTEDETYYRNTDSEK